jgi:hypothetical protein
MFRSCRSAGGQRDPGDAHRHSMVCRRGTEHECGPCRGGTQVRPGRSTVAGPPEAARKIVVRETGESETPPQPWIG